MKPHVTDTTTTSRKIVLRSGNVRVVILLKDGKQEELSIQGYQKIGNVDLWKSIEVGKTKIDDLLVLLNEAKERIDE